MSVLLDALAGTDTSTAPVWLMRQAGRYLPEYRAMRQRYGFWEMVRSPELATEVTLQPVHRFGMDAAILFQDIMSPIPAIGVDVEFAPGPVIAQPVRDVAAVERIRVPPGEELAPFAIAALRLVVAESSVPVIGFAGAPLTLAAYLVEGHGSKEFATFRGLVRSHPTVTEKLFDKLTEITIAYLLEQVTAGAAALQLFDSWAGLFDEPTYRRLALPRIRRIAEAVQAAGVPLVYMAIGSQHLIGAVSELPSAAVSIDWRTPLTEARRRLAGKTLQGNLDPAALLGPRDAMIAEARRVLEAGLGGPHVFNLGHGVLPQTDPDQVTALVEVVRTFDRRAEAVPDSGAA